MSEPSQRRDIWVEKYRPDSIHEIVGHEDITDRLIHYTTSGELPNLLFAGPAGIGKTTAAIAIAKEIYGESWQENFKELNASDDRGIDVVRNEIKQFAQSRFNEEAYKIIFLDEADALTNDAQSALRRTMERYAASTRFILSCNYPHKIIDAIQSRCVVFRLSGVDDEVIAERVASIATAESLDITRDAVLALAQAADGDVRHAVNSLQAVATFTDTITEEDVYTFTNTVRPADIEEVVATAADGDFKKSQKLLDDIVSNHGITAGEIIDTLHDNIWEYGLSEDDVVFLLNQIGETEYRITSGGTDTIQLDALIASLALRNIDEDTPNHHIL